MAVKIEVFSEFHHHKKLDSLNERKPIRMYKEKGTQVMRDLMETSYGEEHTMVLHSDSIPDRTQKLSPFNKTGNPATSNVSQMRLIFHKGQIHPSETTAEWVE
jgi:hypothetical protein